MSTVHTHDRVTSALRQGFSCDVIVLGTTLYTTRLSQADIYTLSALTYMDKCITLPTAHNIADGRRISVQERGGTCLLTR